ncbi:MAG TPA: histidine kinase dimerization/phospho-acceptor domain-containing protein [Bacteroidota bacterium]|nr:histidine kinase dimerization/phospho-acceptor domain-containing protein [Bacteroidota bacterium]
MAQSKLRIMSPEEAVREYHVRTEIATRLSHEFRTPLTSIIGYAETIMCSPDLTAEQRDEFAALIKKEGERLVRLVTLIVEQSIQGSASQSDPSIFK